MSGYCRIYGLMAGITIGFAVWGSVGIEPEPGYVTAAVEDGRENLVSGSGRNESSRRTSGAIPVNTSGAIPVNAAVRPEDGEANGALTLHAQSAVLIDGDTGRVLYEKNGDQFRPMASTTKIMTCILALEQGDGDAVCTVSGEAAAQPKVHLGAAKGTQFYLRDLLYSLMLESHNDSAVMIAEQIGGSVEGFADMMNQKAQALGCADTCFLTPNGLDASKADPDGTTRTHGTTARDLAAIMRYCVMQSPKKEEFLEVTRTSNYSFTDLGGRHSYSCVNHNALLRMMDGALSGKTGFTGGAGYSYVGALESEGRTYILALLGCGWPPHKTYKWADARQLFSYGKESFHYRDIREEQNGLTIPVEDGVAEDWNEQAACGQLFIHDPAQIVAKEKLSEEERRFQVLMAEDEELERKVEVPAQLKAPVAQGDLVGCVTYSLDGMVLKTYPLYADRAVEQKGLSHYVRQIQALFLLPAHGN